MNDAKTETDTQPTLASGHRIQDRYQIEALIARDDRSQVYLAKRLPSGEHVALRALSAEFFAEPSQLEAFRHAVHILQDVQHPSLPRVFGLEEGEGLCFLVTDHAEGISLESLLRSSPPRIEQAADIALCVFSALHVLHSAGLVHGEMKTKAVLTRLQGDMRPGVPAARLLDLCSVRQRAADRLQEQDLLGAAAILYEMVVGVPPSQQNPPTPMPTKNEVTGSAIPPALSAVIMKALSADAHERYASAKDVEQALAQAMNQPLVITPRDSSHSALDAETLATSDTELNLKDDARAAVQTTAIALLSTAKTLPTDGPPLPLPPLQSQGDTLRSAVSDLKPPNPTSAEPKKPAAPLQKKPSAESPQERHPLERWFWLIALLVAAACILIGVWIGSR